jgi:predicted dehydrogenase
MCANGNLRFISNMKVSVLEVISEFTQIAREGTIMGLVRYIWFKLLMNNNADLGTRHGPKAGIGIIGAGTYVASVHLPCLKATCTPLYAIVSRSGVTARNLAHVYSIGKQYSSIDEIFKDKACDSFLIATPHFLHPRHIHKALEFGRYTYCEKPVAIDSKGLNELIQSASFYPNQERIMIGFNRRFSPAIIKLRQQPWLTERVDPAEIHYRINFGLRVDNDMSNTKTGGGRIHGAVCHYVDMISFLLGSPIVKVSALSISNKEKYDNDTFIASLQLLDGSIGSIVFTSESRRCLDTKEEIIITCDGHAARVKDFSKLIIDNKIYTYNRHRYGSLQAIEAFIKSKKLNHPVPISLEDGIVATRITLAIQKSIRQQGDPINIKKIEG